MMRVRGMARRLAGHSYLVSKRYAILQMARRPGRPVVVFSMGKAGSTAIAEALRDVLDTPVFQVFRLDRGGLAAAERRYRQTRRSNRSDRSGRSGRGAARSRSVPFPGALHLWQSQFLVEHPPTPAAPWHVITTVREPVGQAVSAFFQTAPRLGHLRDDATVASLTAAFVDNRYYRAPLRWFEREFEPALGIDVYAHRFDPEAGYGTIVTDAARVLLLRQESFDVAPGAVAEFLGIREAVPIGARNVAAAKSYAAVYERFVREARLPARVLDAAYSSRFVEHFYTSEEIATFRATWARREEDPAT